MLSSFMLQGYPLRPELIESTYLLHAATGNAAYLEAGRLFQATLAERNRQKCGYASVADVATGARFACFGRAAESAALRPGISENRVLGRASLAVVPLLTSKSVVQMAAWLLCVSMEEPAMGATQCTVLDSVVQ